MVKESALEVADQLQCVQVGSERELIQCNVGKDLRDHLVQFPAHPPHAQ